MTDKQNLIEDYQGMIDILYRYHPAGGALHIVTDDGNVEDDHLDFCYNEVQKTDDPEWLKIVMLAILSLLRSIETVEAREFLVDGF